MHAWAYSACMVSGYMHAWPGTQLRHKFFCIVCPRKTTAAAPTRDRANNYYLLLSSRKLFIIIACVSLSLSLGQRVTLACARVCACAVVLCLCMLLLRGPLTGARVSCPSIAQENLATYLCIFCQMKRQGVGFGIKILL